MTISNTNIDEVKLLHLFKATDHRGTFVKSFHSSQLSELGIHFTVKESFYSTNSKNVLRGMHFHTAPHGHQKIIFCTSGTILDVAVDVRKNSPTYGAYTAQELCASKFNALYIPDGFAHGFLTLSEEATVYYLVSGEYNAAHDTGILYNSFGMQWPTNDIVINERDKSFPTLHAYKTQQ